VAICVPLAAYCEGSLWPQAMRTAHEVSSSGGSIAVLLLASGAFYHLTNRMTYIVLDQNPDTETFVGCNAVKRAMVIVVSVAVFRNCVSPLGWLGTATAVLSAYLYSAANNDA
jgi:multidrug transporter EmrE-like cation transporter